MQIKAALIKGTNILKEGKLAAALIDAKALLKFCLSYTDEDLLRNYEIKLTSSQTEEYFNLINRRLLHEPTAYISGQKEFYGHSFVITPDVLIPRNDSETLIDSLVKLYPDKKQALRILDIGTGSGCLIISALKEFEQAQGTALDISAASLEIARKNAGIHQLDHRLQFIESDLFDQLVAQSFDVILCNPPYIAINEIGLMNEETAYEPKGALFAEEEGLFFYRKIAANLPSFLAKGGRAFFEIGFNQQNRVAEIFQAVKLIIEKTVLDLESRPRCIVVKNDN